MPTQMVQVTAGVSARLRLLREGRGWTVDEAAGPAGLCPAAWEAFEEGAQVPADVYRAVPRVFGFTLRSMAFIERAGKQGLLP